VRSYWPSVVASGAMLLATDALSIERTLGSYMLSACDFSQSQLAEFSHLRGSSEALLKYATTYDDAAEELLQQRIFDTWLQRNATELRQMIKDRNFNDVCTNMTHVDRTELTLKWGHDMEVYIVAIDEIRESFIIPFILQVNLSTLITSFLFNTGRT